MKKTHDFRFRNKAYIHIFQRCSREIYRLIVDERALPKEFPFGDELHNMAFAVVGELRYFANTCFNTKYAVCILPLFKKILTFFNAKRTFTTGDFKEFFFA